MSGIDAAVAIAWRFTDEVSAAADRVLARLEHAVALTPSTRPIEAANGLRTAPREGSGAGDGIRTRDILLGKQTLCQLSYSRSGVPAS